MPLTLNAAIAALDTPSSLSQFFIKDSFDITGRTIMAQREGGKHEAREKFIEEFGTSVFWIWGIPVARGVINQFYKDRIDTDIQFKRINTDGIQSYFADDLTKEVEVNGKKVKTSKFFKEDLEGIVLSGNKLDQIKCKLSKTGFKVNETKGLYKKYHVNVTAAAVLINAVILMVAIPKLNQLLSRKIISKEHKCKKGMLNQPQTDICTFGNNKVSMSDFINKTQPAHGKNQVTAKKTSFKGGFANLFDFKALIDFPTMAEKAQLEPVSSMLFLDYCISGGRVFITPRNNNERIENAVKEGGIIFFFYFAAGLIKDKLCKLADKFFNIPIDLDYKILNSKEFLNKLKSNHIKEEVLNFAEISDKNVELGKLSKNATKKAKDELSDNVDELNELKVIKFIDKELEKAPKDSNHPINSIFENFTLQMAQKEGLIDVEFDEELGKWIRHSKKYIQTDKVISLNEHLTTFYEKAFEQIKNTASTTNIEKIISKTKKVKIAAIIGNIAICCASLSFIVPKIQYMIREHRTKTTRAPGIKLYQEMAEKNLI